MLLSRYFHTGDYYDHNRREKKIEQMVNGAVYTDPGETVATKMELHACVLFLEKI